MIKAFKAALAVFVTTMILGGCETQAPELMKAVKQFDSDEVRDRHVADMRKNHMDRLLHKRDETMYQGDRARKYSLNACIDCHVPREHKGEPMRITSDEHFCTTCHAYVSVKLDCFQCHADRPQENMQKAKLKTGQFVAQPIVAQQKTLNVTAQPLNEQLIDANRYALQQALDNADRQGEKKQLDQGKIMSEIKLSEDK